MKTKEKLNIVSKLLNNLSDKHGELEIDEIFFSESKSDTEEIPDIKTIFVSSKVNEKDSNVKFIRYFVNKNGEIRCFPINFG